MHPSYPLRPNKHVLISRPFQIIKLCQLSVVLHICVNIINLSVRSEKANPQNIKSYFSPVILFVTHGSSISLYAVYLRLLKLHVTDITNYWDSTLFLDAVILLLMPRTMT